MLIETFVETGYFVVALLVRYLCVILAEVFFFMARIKVNVKFIYECSIQISLISKFICCFFLSVCSPHSSLLTLFSSHLSLDLSSQVVVTVAVAESLHSF